MGSATPRRTPLPPRPRCGPWAAAVEPLEGRALLAAYAAPDLSGLIRAAERGEDTSLRSIATMTQSLDEQLTAGPLSQLRSGAIDAAAFRAAVVDAVSAYRTEAAGRLGSRYPNVLELIQRQGDRVEAEVAAIVAQGTAGLLTTSEVESRSAAAISALTDGPLRALGSPLGAFEDRTRGLESDLEALAAALGTGASPSITPASAAAVASAEIAAYRASVDGSLFLHPRVQAVVDRAVAALASDLDGLSGQDATAAQGTLRSAVSALDASLLGPDGLFGPDGPIAQETGRER